jgi:iron complex transport system ATP-binding protein
VNAVLAGAGLDVIRGGRRILSDVAISIQQGSMTALLGPNGSGKSTLLRVLSGLWSPTAGSVTLLADALSRLPRTEIAKRIAYLAQDSRCDFAFTVAEMVAMGRHPHRGQFAPETAHDRRAIGDAIALCDVEHLRSRTVERLSGGERQRVAIARCLAGEPGILLLDEPTAHLDLEHALAVLRLCRALADAGKTVVFATHDLGTAARYATHTVLLSGGRVVASGRPAEVLTPLRCREVFAVETEILTTADGRAAFVFDIEAARR